MGEMADWYYFNSDRFDEEDYDSEPSYVICRMCGKECIWAFSKRWFLYDTNRQAAHICTIKFKPKQKERL